MTYRFKVTLSGIKGFFRIYEIGGQTTLYSFHKRMRSDMEFPQDQLIMFKAMDIAGDVVGRYGLFDLGSGTVDNITIAQTVENGVMSFVYFYDVPNRKSVNIALESILEEEGGEPVLVDLKGPNPIDFENGYVAFEDLPDSQRHLPGHKPDWSFMANSADAIDDISDADEDDEDDDDEDGKEVFDGTEDLMV